jgi:uncharacterized protein (TIGR03067 family)
MKVSVRLLLLSGLAMTFGCMRDDPKTDEDRLQGPWVIMSLEVNGKPDYTIGNMTIAEDQIEIKSKNLDRKTHFRLDPAQSPKEIDLVNRAGSVTYAIYALEGDTLRICMAPAGAARPKEFASKARSGNTLFVLKRDKTNIATLKEQYKAKTNPPPETKMEQYVPPVTP